MQGKRGESCRREMLVLFGCGSLTNMSHYKQSACVFWGRGFGEREPDSEREWHFQGEIAEWLAVASLSRSESCRVKSHTTWPPPSPSFAFLQPVPVPPSTSISLLAQSMWGKKITTDTNIVILTVHPSTCLLQGEEAIVMSWKLHRFPPGKQVSPLQFQFDRGIAIYQSQEHVK